MFFSPEADGTGVRLASTGHDGADGEHMHAADRFHRRAQESRKSTLNPVLDVWQMSVFPVE